MHPFEIRPASAFGVNSSFLALSDWLGVCREPRHGEVVHGS